MAIIVENKQQAKPVIKWAGGKYKLSKIILEVSEQKFDFSKFDSYIEPFIGGGGMFFAMTNKYEFKKKIISDINPELINMYIQIRDDNQLLVEALKNIENEFNSLEDSEAKKGYYLNLRNEFNKGIDLEEYSIKQASLFIAINKLGFNGLYRVNRYGHFNVPFGQKKVASLVDEDNFKRVSEILADTEIVIADFKTSVKYANEKALYYFDSPYRPLPNSPSFTSYAKSEFNDESQRELAEVCKKIVDKGGKFILSNSDPVQVDPNDTFFDDLYLDFDIERIQARRAIGATAARRGMVSEILVTG